MAVSASLAGALNQVGLQIVKSLQAELQRQGINVSGELSRSITHQVVGADDGVYLEISMDDYGQYIDEGRKSSKRGGPKQTWRYKIDNWIKLRGITPRQPGMTQKQLAFLITRKINQRGFKAKPFIDKGINNVITQDLSGIFAKAIEQDIAIIFQK